MLTKEVIEKISEVMNNETYNFVKWLINAIKIGYARSRKIIKRDVCSGIRAFIIKFIYTIDIV